MIQTTSKVLFISVHYRANDGVLALLDRFQSLKQFPMVHSIIIDNSSGEECLSVIRRGVARFPNVELLESPTNRGYFGAARFVFDRYLAKGRGLPDWVIVCNHDVFIEDRDFLLKLFDQDSSVGVIAPRIQAISAKVDQNPFMRRRPSWLRWASLRLIYSSYGTAAVWDWISRRKQLFAAHGLRQWWKSSQRESAGREAIYAPHGAFFIFSRRYFDSGGYLDGNLFLYGEEISVAEICRSLGLSVIYEPSLCVHHNEHQSTGKALTRFSYRCQKDALQYVASKYLAYSRKNLSFDQRDSSR